jgi:hypothetical protein
MVSYSCNNNTACCNESDATMEYWLSQLESGTRWLGLLQQLDEAAASRKVFGYVPGRTQVVASQSCNVALINHYMTALPGKTYICCGKSGVGKAMAAMYLLHGDHAHRPNRAIMIPGGDSLDVAATFSQSVFTGRPKLHRRSMRSFSPRVDDRRAACGTRKKFKGKLDPCQSHCQVTRDDMMLLPAV